MPEQLSRTEQLERKRAVWKQHIESWQSSGLDQKAYCRQNDLNYHQFGYWKRRFVQSKSGIRFVPVKIRGGLPPKNGMPSSSLRVIIEQDLQVEIGPDFDPRVLCRLIATLRSLP